MPLSHWSRPSTAVEWEEAEFVRPNFFFYDRFFQMPDSHDFWLLIPSLPPL
ncbi:hypothetical protein QUA20_15975 [Microcoleus sp. Pol7_A1]|uniref:hypothetical protein n=1 Tax=Microcoleus sp. Pol7_A1 TaxID=2818893 RepID=UPI002FD10D98